MPANERVWLRWQGFSVPKRGCTAEEYEDAFAADPEAGRFAIADGASESSFAGLWAGMLTEGFVCPVAAGDGVGWLGRLQDRWAAAVDERPLPWYADAKRQEGAFATFLGLVVRRPAGEGSGRWRAIAVGDSCLFQVRRMNLVRAFPLTHSDEFGSCPELLGSRRATRKPVPQLNRGHGQWQPGDRFLMMTDALAEWFLAEYEAGQRPWRAVDALLRHPSPQIAFAAWIEQLRQEGNLRNDDMTLVRVALPKRRTVRHGGQ